MKDEQLLDEENLERLGGPDPERRDEVAKVLKVYLAGPINGCTDAECLDWRRALKDSTKTIHFVDPMARDYRGVEDVRYREIVELDKRDISRCDAVLASCPKPSVGTSMEILYAWQSGIPVAVVVEAGARVSPWLRYHATRVFEGSHLEALRWLEGWIQ